jgi:hypothetical protein
VKNIAPLLALLACGAFCSAEEGQLTPTDLLVVPEVSDRPVAEGETEERPAPSPAPAASPVEVSAQVPLEAAVAEEAAAADIVPPPFPLSRYEELWKKSPFQLESVAPPVESAGLAQRYALTGIAEISGEPIAFLMERATQRRLMVRKDGAGSGDLALVQIDVSAKKYDDSTVTVRQGAEVGVVKFDAGPAMPPPAMAQGMVPPQVQPGNPAMLVPPQSPQDPGQPGQMAGVPPQVAPGMVPPVPGPGVPANGQVQPPGQPQMPPPRVIRRRAIVPAAP